MSAWGQKATSAGDRTKSAMPPRTDIVGPRPHVRNMPKNRTRGPCLEASTLPMEKRPKARVSRANGLLGTMTRRAIGRVTAGFLLLATPVVAAEPPAELISNFRLKHGEVRVVRDAALDRIALEQARAMATKDNLSHEVLGSFTGRIARALAGRAAENIAFGY